MFYYVEVKNDKIIQKGWSQSSIILTSNYLEISEEIYNKIGKLPCLFTEKDGEIVDVEYIELSDSVSGSTETEILTEYLLEVDYRVTLIELGLI